MKIKFDTDDDLRLKKPLKFPTITIVVRSVFEENGKFYPQIYLDDVLNATIQKIDVSGGIDTNKPS